MDIGFEGSDEGFRCLFGKAEDVINTSQRFDDGEAIFEGVDGTVGSFVESADASVGIESDDQDISEGFGLFEILDVTGMEDIENSIGEDKDFAFAVVLNLGESFLIH